MKLNERILHPFLDEDAWRELGDHIRDQTLSERLEVETIKMDGPRLKHKWNILIKRYGKEDGMQ